jgi:hypothetical protein
MHDLSRFLTYTAASIVLWLLARDSLQGLLFFEGRYSSPIAPYVIYALPGFIFFLIAGAALIPLLKQASFKWTALYASIAGSGHILFSALFTQSFVRDWSGAVLVAMPAVGVAVGAALGASITTALRRR